MLPIVLLLFVLCAVVDGTNQDTPLHAVTSGSNGAASSSKSSTAEYFLSSPVLTIKQTFPGKKVDDYAKTEALREAIRREELADTATSPITGKRKWRDDNARMSDSTSISKSRHGTMRGKGWLSSSSRPRYGSSSARKIEEKHLCSQDKQMADSKYEPQPDVTRTMAASDEQKSSRDAADSIMLLSSDPGRGSSTSHSSEDSSDQDLHNHLAPRFPTSAIRRSRHPISEVQLKSIQKTAVERRQRFDEAVLKEAEERGEPNPFEVEATRYKPRKRWPKREFDRKYRLAVQRRIREKRRSELALKELVDSYGQEKGYKIFYDQKQIRLNAKRLREINLCALKQIGRDFESLEEYNKYRMAGGQAIDRRPRVNSLARKD